MGFIPWLCYIEYIIRPLICRSTRISCCTIKFIKETLKDRIIDVKITDRLTDTPCVLVTADYGWTANMEKIMKAQALRNKEMDNLMSSRKILEINPEDPIIIRVKEDIKDENKIEKSKHLIHFLFDNTMFISGFYVEDPSSYAKKVFNLVKLSNWQV